jgi:cation/acetate symporter
MKLLFTGLAMLIALSSGAVAAPQPSGTPGVGQGAGVTKQQGQAAAAVAGTMKENAPVSVKTNPHVTVPLFLVLIAVTTGVVIWSAHRTKSAADFYTAGGGISGTQNGWAIAGDYMSAASFLGISGMISLYGYDGFMYSVGWLVAYITVLLVIAEPCRNAGKYTLGDILSFRTDPKPVRAAAALSVVAVSTFYLTAQMVGAGKLMQLLLGIDYRTAIVGVGILMVGYVVFGGMTATTWVQIIKAGLMMTGALILSFLVASKAGFSPLQFFTAVATNEQIMDHVRQLPIFMKELEAGKVSLNDAGQRFLEPGLFLTNPLDQISLGLALVLGTAGMPHILMRFLTVPTAQAARTSVIVAMYVIGSFYILTTLLGFGAAIHLTPQNIFKADRGGNMAALMLAQKLGGDVSPFLGDLLLAFFSAVAFATILAVVSGLVLAASAAIAHDIYVNVIKDGRADQQEQVAAARITSLVVGIVAIIIGIAAEKQNVAHLVALAFAVASSGNLPVVLMSLFWRKFNTAGVISGLVVGTFSSIGLVLLSPNMTYPNKVAEDARRVAIVLERRIVEGTAPPEVMEQMLQTFYEKKAEEAKFRGGRSILGLEKPLYTLKNPGIVSIPLGFLAAIFGTMAFPNKRAEDMFDEFYVRQNTGIGKMKPGER